MAAGQKVFQLFRSYAAGMNAAVEPAGLIREDELALIVNGTVRNGFLETRPSFEELPLVFSGTIDQLDFINGKYQGIGFYNLGNTKVIVVAVSGYLYFVDTADFRVIRSPSQHFSPHSEMVWMQQRNRWFIIQDGESPPCIVDGATITQEVTPGGVPCGTFMADGWHRLVVVSPDRRRIYFSDHENDPNSTPISFTEGNAYFANARFFEGPPSLGLITGIRFSPYQDSSTGIGPLVVFFEKGVRAYNVATPRSQWAITDISQTILPNTGSTSLMGYTDRGSDIMFRDHDGHIRSLRNAQQTLLNQGYNMPNDFPVWEVLRKEDATFRQFSCAATSDNRSFFAAHPYVVQNQDGSTSVVHRCLAVLENAHVAAQRENVWTIWTGIPVAGMVETQIAGDSSLVVFSCGDDGRNRLFRLTEHNKGDLMYTNGEPKRFRTEMQFDVGQRDFGNVMFLKAFPAAGVRLTNMGEHVTLKASWSSDAGRIDWFTHEMKRGMCLTVDKCSVFEPLPNVEASLVLPSIPKSHAQFFKAGARFKVQGACRVEELVFEADAVPRAKTHGIKATPAKTNPPLKPACDLNIFSYNITA